jgi:hypothetical protein
MVSSRDSVNYPKYRSCCFYAGRRASSNQVALALFPDSVTQPGFDVFCLPFDASSTVHFRSSPASTPDSFKLPVLLFELGKNEVRLRHFSLRQVKSSEYATFSVFGIPVAPCRVVNKKTFLTFVTGFVLSNKLIEVIMCTKSSFVKYKIVVI